ncbi:hypothetical protein D3C78_516220 [compost metagenome]
MTDLSMLRASILTAIGNQSLLERLRMQHPNLSEEQFWTVRDSLIDEGVLAKGRGRGGSVRLARATDEPHIATSATLLAEQALSMARARFSPECHVC